MSEVPLNLTKLYETAVVDTLKDLQKISDVYTQLFDYQFNNRGKIIAIDTSDYIEGIVNNGLCKSDTDTLRNIINLLDLYVAYTIIASHKRIEMQIRVKEPGFTILSHPIGGVANLCHQAGIVMAIPYTFALALSKVNFVNMEACTNYLSSRKEIARGMSVYLEGKFQA